MAHSYSHAAHYFEDCPKCGCNMKPHVEGMVDGGQPYDDRVSCSHCGKTLWQSESPWVYYIMGVLVLAPFILGFLKMLLNPVSDG